MILYFDNADPGVRMQGNSKDPLHRMSDVRECAFAPRLLHRSNLCYYPRNQQPRMIYLLDDLRQYVRQLGPYIAAAIVLLSLGVIGGIFLADHPVFSGFKIRQSIGEFGQLFLHFPKPLLALAIFINNGLKTLLAIVLGVIFGIVPVIFIVANGVAIGLVLQLSVQSRGLAGSLLGIIPHGVFELPGITLGVAIGLRIGVYATKRLMGRPGATVGSELRRGLKLFGTVIVPLLFVGAIIEAFLTATLVGK